VDILSFLAKCAFWNLPATRKSASYVRYRQRSEREEEVLRRDAKAIVGMQIFDLSTCFVDDQGVKDSCTMEGLCTGPAVTCR
jgi:hypothetical protein